MVNALAVEGVSRTLRSRRLATAANRESCDVSLMTAAQLIPQSDCAELHQVDVANAVGKLHFVPWGGYPRGFCVGDRDLAVRANAE